MAQESVKRQKVQENAQKKNKETSINQVYRAELIFSKSNFQVDASVLVQELVLCKFVKIN